MGKQVSVVGLHCLCGMLVVPQMIVNAVCCRRLCEVTNEERWFQRESTCRVVWDAQD